MFKLSLDNIIVAVFILTVVVQLYVYLRYFLPFALYQAAGILTEKQPFVSVIIAAKNESDNLKRLLPLVLNQDYPDFELVLVDDHSTDDTAVFLQGIKNAKLQLHQLYDEKGKKAAIKKAIEKAQSDKLVFIDADCMPKTTYWLRLMSEKLIDKNSIVLGYAPYFKEATFLNKIIRYETLTTALQYFSTALAGKAYMGVGRNMSYTKEIFKKSNAFDKHADIAFGDDDLIVNEMAEDSTVEICIQKEAHCISRASSSWSAYYYQKRRHLEAGKRYKFKDKLSLGIFGAACFLFWLCALYLLINQLFNPFLLLIFVLKLIFQYFLYAKVMQKLGERDLLWSLPFLELSYLFLMIFFGLSTYLLKLDRWK